MSRTLHVVDELACTDGERLALERLDGLDARPAQVDLPVQRNEAQDLVARARELGGQRCCDVAQTARLGVRGVLGADEADAHWSS
jgi:hypothetical protein